MGTRELPSGDVCFLFTDVESSTAILRAVGDAAWAERQAQMQAAIRTAVESNSGYFVNTEGDGCFAAFGSCDSATQACTDAQRALNNTESLDGHELRVRMGLHVGIGVRPQADDYVALAVHQAARVMSAASGRQVLVSNDVVDRCADRERFVELGRFSLRDFDGPQRLYELVHDHAPRVAPRVPLAFDHRVPGYGSAMVGREQEMAELLRALDSAALVTLVGPEGVGKTRLALAALAQLSADAAVGPWFADLAATDHAAGVGDLIARAVGCPNDVEVDRYLDDLLDDRPGVLCLDSCQHLSDAAAAAADLLLSWCPSLRIVATSRQPLGIGQEVVYPVPALAVPTAADPAEILDSPAGRLFVERIRRVRPDFGITSADAIAVHDLCVATDGLPLGIELAAALSADSRSSPDAAVIGDQRGRPAVLVDKVLDALSPSASRSLAALTLIEAPIPPTLADVALDGAGVAAAERDDVLAALLARSLIERDSDGYLRMNSSVRAGARRRLDPAARLAVLAVLLEACLRATTDEPLPLSRHEPVAPTSIMLLAEADLPARDRQQLGRQLAPWCLGRLSHLRARALFEAALTLGNFGPSTAALHLAVADTYAHGTQTVDAERHLRDAARVIGEHDAVDPRLIERLQALTARPPATVDEEERPG